MVDSTEFNEVYNTTGEVLQNVQPIVSTNDLLTTTLAFGVLLILLMTKTIKTKRLSF